MAATKVGLVIAQDRCFFTSPKKGEVGELRSALAL
jgi:hypothetical protein